jgi:hypothetical protein
MRTIWKFDVFPGHFTVVMPEGARVLTCQVQGGNAQMWAMVDPDAPTVKKDFVTTGTGKYLDDSLVEAMDYIGTFQPTPGLVFHLFEVTR